MKNNVIKWSKGETSDKIVSKETLNHRDLIEMVSGLDVYKNTQDAFFRAYKALGIDIINRVPLNNAPEPTPQGISKPHKTLPYNYCSLGVYDTVMRHTYACKTPDDIWNLDMDALSYENLLVPVPHPCKRDDIQIRDKSIGQTGLYYPMLYTTLFMWAVEVLGWEVFMMAAALEPQRFYDYFLLPCVKKSKSIVAEMAESTDSPFVFVHDDLANSNGPMFDPKWYNDYVFLHYPDIFSRAKQLGKKIIFVADGNMEAFLPKLIESGVDGFMFENPATSLDVVIEYFGQSGKFLIGGIDTVKLTTATPDEVRQMVFDLAEKMANCPGFAISSCGGLHGNIPLANLEAYFDARVEIGATPKDWRNRCKV